MATFTKIDYQAASFVASFNLTSTPGVAAGHRVMVAMNVVLGNTITLADSGGNTYTVAVTGHNTSSGHFVSIASAYIVTPIGAAGTITLSGMSSDAVTAIAYDVAPTAGLTFGASDLDQFTSLFNASSTAMSTGATGTLAQAVEIAFAAFECAGGSPTFTAGGSFTHLDENWSAGFNQGLMTEWMETAATTAVTGTGTLTSGADATEGVIATFKETASGGGGGGPGFLPTYPRIRYS